MTAGSALALDYGGSNLRVGRIARDGRVLSSATLPVPAAVEDRRELPARVVAEWGGDAVAIGLAVAGTVTAGVLTWTANLGLHHVPYAEMLGGAVPVRVVNDARAAGYAEARTAFPEDRAVGAEAVLVVTVGTGIGGAVVVADRLVEGSGHAGEIGHMTIDPGGPACSCGRRGCWERVVGGRALHESLGGRWATVSELAAAAARGEEAATAHIAERAQLFAAGIDNLCAILAPTAVVLGGGIIARGGPVAEAYVAAARDVHWLRGELRLSALGDHAGMIGAGLLAWDLVDRGASRA